MNAVGYNIKWRTPRLKPWRSEADEAERKRMCNKLSKLPERYWQHDVHLYMDNTRWKIPMSAKRKKVLECQQGPEALAQAIRRPQARIHEAKRREAQDEHWRFGTLVRSNYQGQGEGLALSPRPLVWRDGRGFVLKGVGPSSAEALWQ